MSAARTNDTWPSGSTSGGALSLDPVLWQVLVCPADHGEVTAVEPGSRPELPEGGLLCATCGLTYPVLDGIPVMLATEAIPAG